MTVCSPHTSVKQGLKTVGVLRAHPHRIAIGLLLLALLPFCLNLTSYFLADDFVLLSWTHVASLAEVPAFFDPHTWWFYRPLVKTFYWIGQLAFGLHPTPFHVVSLLLHGLNAGLIYWFLFRQGYMPWVARMIALCGFHRNPHSAETVSWIAAIGDLAGAACLLGALIAFQHFYQSARWFSWGISLVLFMIGLFTRETTAIFPLLLITSVILLGWRRSIGRRVLVLTLASYFVVLLGWLLLQTLDYGQDHSAGLRAGMQFHPLNIDSILLGILDYIHGLVPGGQVLAQLPLAVVQVSVWVEWLLILGLVVSLWCIRQRVMLLGLIWMLVTPLLFVFFVTPTDRYFYLPSIGYAVFVAALLGWAMKAIAQWSLPVRGIAQSILAGVVAILLLAQVQTLLQREQDWHAAAVISAGVIHDVHQAVPQPGERARFYFVGVPATIGRIPLFPEGLTDPIRWTYRGARAFTVLTATCQDLIQNQLPRESYVFYYKGDGVTLLHDKSECR